VDAGANIGLFTVYYASRLPNAQILSIEPESSNFTMLEKNTSAYPNINLIRKGLWCEGCMLKVVNESSEKWAFEVIPDPNGNIEAVSMNEIMGDSQPDLRNILVKMDIEGADQNVLSKNLEWLDRVTNLYIEVHDSWRELFCALNRYDYGVTKFRENLLINIKGKS
jgi:FkbM family methyltransferase